MENIINQFLQLPPNVRNTLSSPSTIERLETIESKYNLKLADIVMRVAVKNIPLSTLASELAQRFTLEASVSQKVSEELRDKIFSQVSTHLGFNPQASQDQVFATPAHEGSLGVMPKDPEIQKHEMNLSDAPPKTEFDMDKFTDQIIDLLGIGLDHVMRKRLLRIIESRLQDVRDKLALADQLERSSKIGGMGFVKEQSQKVVATVEQAWEDIHAKHLNIIEKDDMQRHPPAQTKSIPQKTHPPITQQREIPAMLQPEKPKAIMDAPHVELAQDEPEKPARPTVPADLKPKEFIVPSIQPPISPISQAVPEQSKVEAPQQKISDDEKVQEQPLKEPIPAPRPQKEVPHFMPKIQHDFDPNKKTMQDIVPPSKLIGPIEELEQMAIEDFRHLGQTTDESAERLKEKIHILEKESFERRSAGVKAWRKSPLMNEYLSVGRDSIENNRDFKQLIIDRREKNPNSMTSEEFEAISTVNSSLRY